jgi:hypothetical protein
MEMKFQLPCSRAELSVYKGIKLKKIKFLVLHLAAAGSVENACRSTLLLLKQGLKK